MKTKAQVIFISSALLAAVAGTAVAFNGYGNCFQGGPGFQARGQCYQSPAGMGCMQPMNWRRNLGQGWMRGENRSPMRGVYLLDDLTGDQIKQLDALRQQQQLWRSEHQKSRLARRDELKVKLEAILTDEQNQALKRWNRAAN